MPAHAIKTYRGIEGIAPLNLMKLSTRCGKPHTPAGLPPWKRPWYRLNRTLEQGVKSQPGQSGEKKNLLILLGFEPRITQYIAQSTSMPLTIFNFLDDRTVPTLPSWHYAQHHRAKVLGKKFIQKMLYGSTAINNNRTSLNGSTFS